MSKRKSYLTMNQRRKQHLGEALSRHHCSSDEYYREFKQVVVKDLSATRKSKSASAMANMLEDDAALEIIAAEGEQDVDGIWRLIGIRGEARKRSSGPRGRAALARLMPLLFRQMIAQPQSMTILERVLTVIRAIMSRTAYIELFAENRAPSSTLSSVCRFTVGFAAIGTASILLDELIDPQHLYQLPDLTDYPSVSMSF